MTWCMMSVAGLAVVIRAKLDVDDVNFQQYVNLNFTLLLLWCIVAYSKYSYPYHRDHERLGLAVIVFSWMQACVGLIKAFTQFTFKRV